VPADLLFFAVDTLVVFGALVLAAANLIRLPRNGNAWLASAILLGTVCAVVLARDQYGYWIAEPYRIDVGPWEPLLNVGRNLGPALLMLLCHSLFQEQRRLPRALLVLVAVQVLLEEPVHVLVGTDTPAQRLVTEAAPGLLQALFAGLAVYWTVAGWSADLVETRRRMRVVVLAIIGVLMFGSVLLLRVLIPWNSVSNYYANVALEMLHAVVVTGILVSLISRRNLEQYLDPGRVDVAEAVLETPALTDERAGAVAHLERMMADGAYRQPGLSIASLAERLQTPEYRLRRLIHESLGFRNFNSFLHHYRVAEACRLLKDPEERRTPILTIALSVGYQSINTFNRGFREVMGTTPSAFRADASAFRADAAPTAGRGGTSHDPERSSLPES